jgi:nicotinate phosphoribosyltransferase
MASDIVTVEGDVQPGEPLLKAVMRGGQRFAGTALADIRCHAADNLARLPEPLRQLQEAYKYEVHISGALRELAAQVDRNASH